MLADGYSNVRVIVIDNGSSDGSVELIKNNFPAVDVIANARNLGYSRGNNQGIEAALRQGAEYLLFLNNDAALLPGTLEKIIGLFQQNPECGAASPFIVYADQPEVIWFGGGSVSLWSGQVRHEFIRQRLAGLPKSSMKTEYITGCALVVKAAAIEQVGHFDENYVLYSEDVDLCLRLRKAGWNLIVTSEALATHQVSASTGGGMSPLKAFYRARSTALLIKRWAPWWAWLFLPFAGTIGLLAVLAGLIFSGKVAIAVSILRGVFNGLLSLSIPKRFRLEFSTLE